MITQQTTLLDDSDGSMPPSTGELHVLVMSPDSFISLPLPLDGFANVGRSSRCPIRLEDPLASREHARLHVHSTEGGFALQIEDLDSANGTRVRDRAISSRVPTPFEAGEAIAIGSTVLMVQQNGPALGLRRLWSHAYFEGRLEDECARATGASASFAVARVHLIDRAPWTRVVPVLVRNISAPHLFAAYGPHDYEILFVEASANAVLQLMQVLSEDLRQSSLEATHGVAWYPRDGRSADALLARANGLVKQRIGKGRSALAIASEAHEAEVPNGAGMERLRELAKRAASSNITVLILGETGTGKDVLARTIHKLSGRKGEFVALNCAALAATLIESELFGHEKGSFSGAIAARVGLLEAANGGTVFLDEIGEMPLTLQSRLLRAIEMREVLPVGAVKTRSIDVRFLAATNRNLESDVEKGTFRRDLFYRLNILPLTIPPLRSRTDEIPDLVETFIAATCVESGRAEPPVVSPQAMDQLLKHAWPGNIRELKNAIERALVLCDGSEILLEHLPEKMRSQSGLFSAEQAGTERHPALKPAAQTPVFGASSGGEHLPWLRDPAKVAERQQILSALDANAWSQTRAAKSLGMPRRTFVSKLEYYRIPRPQKTGRGVDA